MIVIRMSRQGRTNRPHFRIGVYDVRTRRDGPPIEYLGHYDPLKKAEDATRVTLDDERCRYWISQGASVSETMTSFLKRRGIVMPVRKRVTKRRPKKVAKPAAKKSAKPSAAKNA